MKKRLAVIAFLIIVLSAFGTPVFAGGIGGEDVQGQEGTPSPSPPPTASPAPTDGTGGDTTGGGSPGDTGTTQGGAMKDSAEAKREVNNQIEDMMSKFRPQADIEAAAAVAYGVSSTINLIIGLMGYVIVVGLAIFTAVDICYISIPVFQEKCEAVKSSGNSTMQRMGTRETKEGTKLRFVSLDAQYAVESANIGEGRSPIKTYLLKHMGTYIFTGIVLYMLLSGNIEIIVNFALRIVAAIMGAIQEITVK